MKTYVYSVTDENGKTLFSGEREAAYKVAAEGKLRTVTPHEAASIKYLPKGEYFKRKPDAKSIYVRGEYVREEKKYSCYDTEDINREIFLKGDTVVYVGFTY
jgi:hypothetical protein